MEPLTKRQERALKAILKFFDDEDRPPTIRELAELLRCHVKTVYQYILVLERKGYIERRKGRIHVPPALRGDRSVPIVGRVAAGTPILAAQNIDGYLSLAPILCKREGTFALTVRGDSMVGAHICDGDYVIVRQQPTVENGEIGVVIVNDEATVKRIRKAGRHVRLLAENPAIPPMELDTAAEDVRIVGKVVGVVRKIS